AIFVSDVAPEARPTNDRFAVGSTAARIGRRLSSRIRRGEQAPGARPAGYQLIFEIDVITIAFAIVVREMKQPA
ncbi:hypothetical protein, partial [Burkholderia sp.]